MRSDNKANLRDLLLKTDSLEVFWFPFNGIFDGLIKIDGDKATIVGLGERELSNGKVIRVASDSSNLWWWDPWNDDLWSREIDFTTAAWTKK